MGDGDARIGCGVFWGGSATHPLRTIRTIVNEVLAALDTEFEALYEASADSRLRRSDCCAPHCCRHFTPCVPSVS